MNQQNTTWVIAGNKGDRQGKAGFPNPAFPHLSSHDVTHEIDSILPAKALFEDKIEMTSYCSEVPVSCFFLFFYTNLI